MRLKGPKVISFLVLNAKGGEIQAKENGSANHLWISKIVELESMFCPKSSYCKKLVSYGEELWLWQNGEFLALVRIYSWNIFLFAKTSVLI
jgi:hypothetical protein